MKEPKRVLQLCSLNGGGIEAFVMNIYRKIDKNKVNFDFYNHFSTTEKQLYEDEALIYNARIYKTGCNDEDNIIIRNFRKIITLYSLIKRNKYDIVHIHATDSGSLREAIIAKIAGVKMVIVHSHNTSVEGKSLKAKLKKFLHNKTRWMWKYVATNYFACSQLAAEWMYSKRLNKSCVKVIKNGIEIEKYAFDEEKRNKIRNYFELNTELVIGHVGRFAHQKNHEFIIDIFKEITKLEPNSKLILVGNGELEENIRGKVNELNLTDKVKFLGIISNVNEVMQAMDIFLLPSFFEGLPVVGVEAQASGLKLFVSDSISNELSITSNVKYLSLNLSDKEWACEIIKNRYYLRKNMCNEIIEEGYNINNIANLFEDFYLKEENR